MGRLEGRRPSGFLGLQRARVHFGLLNFEGSSTHMKTFVSNHSLCPVLGLRMGLGFRLPENLDPKPKPGDAGKPNR